MFSLIIVILMRNIKQFKGVNFSSVEHLAQPNIANTDICEDLQTCHIITKQHVYMSLLKEIWARH